MYQIVCWNMAKNSERRDLFPGALEIMILQSLLRKPMHGYALVKHIQEVSDDLLQVEEGSLYPALQRMLREGWVESEMGTSAKGLWRRKWPALNGCTRGLRGCLPSRRLSRLSGRPSGAKAPIV
jgi:PadR family transcriptional regulator